MKREMDVQVKGLAKAVEKIVESEVSKSQKMKQLFDLGIEVKEIANIMGVRYNFVYNVVSNYANVNKIPVAKTQKTGKKDQIIAMHLEGKSNKEISISLETNYNYVFSTIKAYKASQPQVEAVETKAE